MRLAVISGSRWMSEGARDPPAFFSIFCQSREGCLMSAAYSASPLPSPTVRAMRPTPFGLGRG